ncbi:endopeptidase La [Mycoplasma sp. BRA285]
MPKKPTNYNDDTIHAEFPEIKSTQELLKILDDNEFFGEKSVVEHEEFQVEDSKINLVKIFGIQLDVKDIVGIDGIAVVERELTDKQFYDLYEFATNYIDINDKRNQFVVYYDFEKYMPDADKLDINMRESQGVYVRVIAIEKDEAKGVYRLVFEPLEPFSLLEAIPFLNAKVNGEPFPSPHAILLGVRNIPEPLPWKDFVNDNEEVKMIQAFIDTIRNIANSGSPFGKEIPMSGEDDTLSNIDRNFIPFKQKIDGKGKRYTFNEIEDFFKKYYTKKISKTSDQYIYQFLSTIINFLDPKEFDIKFDLYAVLSHDRQMPYQVIMSQITQLITTQMEVSTNINEKLTKKLGRQQQEFIAREKIKQLQDYLEEMGADVEEDDYTAILKDPKLRKIYPESVIKLISEEEKRSSEMMPASPEAAISKNYTNTLKKLPWRKVQRELLDIKHVKDTLDQYHYGLEEIKERILEYLAVLINVKKQNKDEDEYTEIDNEHLIDNNLFQEEGRSLQDKYNNVPILTLVGPPGTGKTSLSKAIAEALGRKFLKISLGGVHDESEIRGHRRTYVGAMPGKIIKGITKTGVSNPVILLDEIDKMASDFKGDPASAMLEVLDPEQNTKFQDHYLEHEYDLSKCIFIATANYFDNIPPALVDRVEIIELSAYTLSEKVNIAKKYLVPKVLEQAGLDKKMFKIDDATLEYIIKHYTMEAGVRGLKRILDKLARKIVLKKLNDVKLKSFEITIDKLEDLLGVIKFKDEEKEEDNLPGVVTGLAYTSYGGSTLPIEVTTFEGKPEIKLTGSLKEVMQESAQIALTYVRANAKHFGINDFDFEANTIHIHVPEGAVPKDGPSAGVTFTTAIISALSQRAVPNEIGMTGEITLRGKVLEIGGLKEKSFAASSKGLKRIFIPAGNVKNLKDVPLEIKNKLQYIPVKNYEEIYSVIFENKEPKEIITFESK